MYHQQTLDDSLEIELFYFLNLFGICQSCVAYFAERIAVWHSPCEPRNPDIVSVGSLTPFCNKYFVEV